MDKFLPGVPYKVMDEGKARLAHVIEETFNMEPMFVQEKNKEGVWVTREIKHKFEAFQKLNKKIQEHHDIIFKRPANAKASAGDAAQDKMGVPFCFGAFKVHRQSRWHA